MVLENNDSSVSRYRNVVVDPDWAKYTETVSILPTYLLQDMTGPTKNFKQNLLSTAVVRLHPKNKLVFIAKAGHTSHMSK